MEMLLTYNMLPMCRPPCADLANKSVPLFIRPLSCCLYHHAKYEKPLTMLETYYGRTNILKSCYIDFFSEQISFHRLFRVLCLLDVKRRRALAE